MDPIDAQLLNILQDDCWQSLAEIGRRVGLSISAVNERLKKLRARGDVRAYVALINPQMLGYTTCAFLHIAIEGKKDAAFVRAVLKMPEAEECHHVSGEFGYLLKLWARGLEQLERFVDDKIREISGVIRTQTFVVLSSPKDRVTGLAAQP